MMKDRITPVDYSQFRLRLLNTDQFRHLKLLLYWPVFGLLFWYAERGVQVDHYIPCTAGWTTTYRLMNGF